MASDNSIAFLKKRVGLILVILWIALAALFFFAPILSKGNNYKANTLAKSFTYAYVDRVCGKSAKNVSYVVKNWKYQKEHYQITVKMEFPGCVNVFPTDPNKCKAVMTYAFTLNENDKLVSFNRLNGNACALELEAAEATRNALKNIPEFQSKMEEYVSKK